MTAAGLPVHLAARATATEVGLQRYYSLFLTVFLALALTRFSPLEPRSAVALDVGAQGDLLKQIGYVCLFIAALAPAVLYRPAQVVRAIPVSFLLFFTWCAVTLFWSSVPEIAGRRLILTFMIFATLFICGTLLPAQRTVAVAARVGNALVLLSLAACVLVPALAVHQPGDPESGIVGDWRGLFYHKNLFGSVAAIAGLMNLHASLVRRRSGDWVLFGLSLFALWMSGSKTSLGVAGLAALVMLLWLWARRSRYVHVWAGLSRAAAPLIIAGSAWWFSGPGLQLLSDPEALTGRGRIWQMMSGLIAEHPWGGLGYQSVFQTGHGGVMSEMSGKAFFQTLSHAHNGYVEIAVSTGLIGLALLLWALAANTLGPIGRIRRDPGALVPLLASLCVFAMAQAAMESGLADRDRPVWILFVLALAVMRAMDRGARDGRLTS